MKGKANLTELKRIIWGLNDMEYDYIIAPHDDKNELIIEKRKKKRSLNANAYFHVMVNEIARATGMSDDECKIKEVLQYGTIAKNIDGSPVTVKLPKGTDISQFYKYSKWYGEKDGFDFYMFYKETHTLDSSEMAKLIDGVVSDCKLLGIETLDDLKLKALLSEWK